MMPRVKSSRKQMLLEMQRLKNMISMAMLLRKRMPLETVHRHITMPSDLLKGKLTREDLQYLTFTMTNSNLLKWQTSLETKQHLNIMTKDSYQKQQTKMDLSASMNMIFMVKRSKKQIQIKMLQKMNMICLVR